MNKYRLLVWMILLTALAGAVNAAAVFRYAGTTVSHVTGLLSKFAVSVSAGDLREALYGISVIFSFFAGAVAAGFATGERVFHLRRVYGVIIMVVGVLLLLPLFLAERYAVRLLAFLMGLQNGTVVSFRGILVRMTHMTGNLTDFGVYLGCILRGKRNERPISGLVPAAAIAGYTAGGILGILLFRQIGMAVFAFISAVYILLGIVYFCLLKTCGFVYERTEKNE